MAAFTPGNIVIYRVGAVGGPALSTAATAAFLDEYTPAGVLVQSIPLPTTDSGSNQTLTAAGSQAEGFLTLSTDGRYLLMAGYDAAVGTAAVAGTTAATVNRVVGRVGADGIVDTTTWLSDFASAGNARGVASTNGTDLWLEGSTGGVRYTTFGSHTSTQLATTPTNIRTIGIFNGQLYVGAQTGAFRLATVGTGTPTTSGQTITNLPGFPTATGSPYQFFFADLTAAVAGLDTVYVADDGGTLQKYSLVGGNWTANGTITASAVRGLTGSVSGTNVTMYLTSASTLSTFTDTSGYNVNISGSITTLATASANTAFRGVAFAPQAAPSPGTLAIADASVAEGNSGTTALNFTVSRTGGSAGIVGATWTITFGTADAGDLDGAQSLTGTVSFADGDTSETITVNIAGDTSVEPNETFTVTLSAPTGGVALGDASAIGTINNDDVTPVPGDLSIADASVVEGDSGTTQLAFTVTRATGDDGAVSATWTVTFEAGDTADSADLGATLTGTVNFADGETSKQILVDVNGDTDVEGDETFTITLSAPTGGATLTDAVATGTITNDDSFVPVPGNLSIADSSVVEGNSGTTAISFTVTRASGDDGAVGATWTASFGTADAGDFAPAQAFTGSVDFADGETSKTISLDVRGDNLVEPNETFTVTLSAPTGGASLGDDSATGTITNDDAIVFINEFHYDDVSTDSGEAIEIAGLAGTNLSGWSLVLYNFTGGATYATINLSGILPNQDDGYGTLSFTATGLQNGPNDGIALVNPSGIVVQFLSYEGVLTATNGPAVGMTSTDVGVSEEPAVADGFSLQLTGTGAVYSDFHWVAAAANTFGAVNTGQDFLGSTATGLVSVADASVLEGNSGVSNLVFTIHRAGGLGQTASVDYTIALNGSADAGDLGPGAVLSGTVTFNPGDSAIQVTLPVQGDTVGEPNDTLSITLSNPVGNISVTDDTATGTILNDDPVVAAIHDIQGASHTSPFLHQLVIVTAIVTAVDSNGFYMQDPSPDANDATSEGVFVFTNSAPTVAVGDNVTVTGTVSEFLAAAGSLTVTEIDISSAPVVNSSGNPLPAATVIGTGGRIPPTQTFEDDGFATFDPANDGLDFYESMEGMLVTVKAPLVVADSNSFGETWVVASGGAGATGVNARGGITLSAGDNNPERIQLDNDPNLSPGYTPHHSQGDVLNDVTGIMNYAFSSYEVLVTATPTTATDVTLGQEVSALTGDATHLTVASFNIENADPTDPQAKFDALASDVVAHLNSPDIIGLQEVQDADGAGNGTNYSGAVTAQKLIDAIVAAGGPTYQYVEIAPTANNTTGGEPNGNIRNGFLYNPARVTYVAGSAELVPGAAYNGSRNPLAADFIFNGETVKVIDNHWTSRGGSDPFEGSTQPPANAGDGARLGQGQALRAYIDAQAAAHPETKIVTVGDFNSYYYEPGLQAVQAGGVMTNLFDLLPVEERYSYMFDGNLQAFDNILVSRSLLPGAQFDAVHLQAELSTLPNRPTDHDQALARLLVTANDIIYGTQGNDDLDATNGNDSFYLQQGGDDSVSGGVGNDFFYFGGALTGADSADGGEGNDQFALQGNYSVTFGTGIVGMESLVLLPGDDTRFGDPGTNSYDYDITTVDENVAAGQRLTIDANRLRSGEDFTFDGSAETDGNFFIVGGNGVDTLTGGAQSDTFLFGENGQWGVSDTVDGGSGLPNQLAFRGDYTIVFGAGQLTNIDSIALVSAFDTRFGALGDDFDYVLTMNDGNVPLGEMMTIDAAMLHANETLTFDGSLELDGSFRVAGGAGDDVITGSQNGDILIGRGGADTMTGGAGADQFVYRSIGDSTTAAPDEIQDFTDDDIVDLMMIDANENAPGDQAFIFSNDGTFHNVAGELKAVDNAGVWTISGDVNGDGAADFEFVLTVTDAHIITASDFIL